MTIFISQTSVAGNVYNENESALSGVLVVNISTSEQTVTDSNGFFLINATFENELRFLRKNYERFSVIVNSQSPLKIKLEFKPEEIEEVILNYKPIGNLKEDLKHFETQKKVLELNTDLWKYNRTRSSNEIMKSKSGEFVQPKGQGFETTKKGYQWKVLDVAINLEDILGTEYFDKMGLKKQQIFSFINFVLKDFNTDNIRRFGRLTSSDISKFQFMAEEILANYNAQFGNE